MRIDHNYLIAGRPVYPGAIAVRRPVGLAYAG